MTTPVQIPTSGAPLKRAKAAMILLHGRGASAESMLALAEMFAQPDIACLAPQAPGGSWYPCSFLAPIERNEPHLSRSLATIGKLVDDLAGQGFGPERVALLGFSQGGCLALEFAARNVQSYGAVIGLSAGLIGPEGTPRAYPDRSPARAYSSAAATSMRISRCTACTSPPVSLEPSAPTSSSASIRAWATPSTTTRCARCASRSPASFILNQLPQRRPPRATERPRHRLIPLRPTPEGECDVPIP